MFDSSGGLGAADMRFESLSVLVYNGIGAFEWKGVPIQGASLKLCVRSGGRDDGLCVCQSE